MVGAFTLEWRWASRRWSLPCPSLLAWTLDNSLVVQSPLTLKTLDRIGFRPGEKVLEIGPGPGRLLIPAAKRVMPGGEVVGIDIQPKMIERLEAREKAAGITNLTTILGDATQPHVPEASFDLAFFCTTLGEIPNRSAALSQCYPALKPGETTFHHQADSQPSLPDPLHDTASRRRSGIPSPVDSGRLMYLYRQLRQAVEKRRLRHTDPSSGNGPESSIPMCRSKLILVYPPSVRCPDLRPFQKGHCTPTP